MKADHSQHPKEYDAVLGGKASTPATGAILGGMAGVERRFASDDPATRIAAIQDVLKYGKSGLNLALQGLEDPSKEVQKAAYLVLRNLSDPQIRQVVKEYLPHQHFDCLHTVKAGSNIVVSPDGTRTASLQGKWIKVGHLETHEWLFSIEKYPKAKEFFCLAYNAERLIRVRNIPRPTLDVYHREDLEFTLTGHEADIRAVAISHDHKILASCSLDKTIKLWNLQTGKLIYTFGSYLTIGAHSQGVECIAFSPNNQMLASGSYDGTIKLWNLRTRERLRTLKNYANCLTFSPDGQTLVSSSWDRKIRLWNVKAGEVALTLEGHFGNTTAFAFSPDGRILAMGSGDSTVQLWKATAGEHICTLTGHQNAITSLAFHWDGETLISSSIDKTVKIWGVR